MSIQFQLLDYATTQCSRTYILAELLRQYERKYITSIDIEPIKHGAFSFQRFICNICGEASWVKDRNGYCISLIKIGVCGRYTDRIKIACISCYDEAVSINAQVFDLRRTIN